MYKTFLGFLVLMLCLGLAQDKAAPKELVQYIRDARKAGLNDGQIQQNAVKAGWPAAVVSEAIANPPGDAKPVSNDPPPATPEGAPARPANPAAASGAAPAATTWEPANNPASLTTMTRPDSGTKTSAPETERLKTAPTSGVSEDYRIGEGDVLQISVLGEPTASVGSVVVRSDGKITMPLLKEIAASGMTPTELEKIITEQLSKMIRVPDVTVIVAQSNSQIIFMVGTIKKEGPLHYTYRDRKSTR